MTSKGGLRYEFASPGWIAFMHGMVTDRMERFRTEAPDIAWSICEVFTDPPTHLSASGAPLAWSCLVRSGELIFEARERDDVEFKVIADYDAVVPLGRYDTMGDPGRQKKLFEMAASLQKSGTMKIVGDRSKRDARVGDFHDLIARVTA